MQRLQSYALAQYDKQHFRLEKNTVENEVSVIAAAPRAFCKKFWYILKSQILTTFLKVLAGEDLSNSQQFSRLFF